MANKRNIRWNGERLRKLREEQGWSQTELGERAGMDKVEVSRYERGERSPSFDSLVALADALEVSLDEFRSDKAS